MVFVFFLFCLKEGENMTPFMGELIGTALLIIFGAGVCANVNLKGSFAFQSGWIVIAAGWGLAVAMAVYAVGQFSGAHLNPAVTLALAFAGDFAWGDVLSYITAQMIGAFLGAAVVFLHFYPHWRVTEDEGTKLGVFATGPAIQHTASNLLSEIIGTFILTVGILSIGANQFTEGLNPFIVGLLIVAIGVSLGGTTGYAINPARDLGPRLAHFLLPIAGKGSSNWPYAWIPVIGPLLGGSLGGLFYRSVFLGDTVPAFWAVAILTAAVWLVAFIIGKKHQTVSNQVDIG
ncbi:Glycerol uptake facilitator protein [Bacillus thermotolerans]|uniref:Glycerol uptake facilitator protein n=2 Tax=Bacillus thermotolerans TaxID=1221996 RepID=A0A0F5I032_BACTR|nr:Glycerol uptake facilitator protein [Bacillus thermotolerans]KKB42440.1 Glycerol uptake facilitator protein [Bacillus thermotolerans]KKB44613.1 Glycerol uptake facilitator protein [Bacillus thermotolerans]